MWKTQKNGISGTLKQYAPRVPFSDRVYTFQISRYAPA